MDESFITSTLEPVALEVQSNHYVAASFPSRLDHGGLRLAIITDAATTADLKAGRYFFHESTFAILPDLLSKVGINPEICYVGAVCPFVGGRGRFEYLDWRSAEIQRGLELLAADITQVKPNILILLGDAPLHAFMNGNLEPRRSGDRYIWPCALDKWRGSLFRGAPTSPAPGVKCIATYHPDDATRRYHLTAFMRRDLAVAVAEGRRPELVERDLQIDILTPEVGLSYTLDYIHRCRTHRLAIDIEGGAGGITSFAIAWSENAALVIPFETQNGLDVWTETEEIQIWLALKQLLEDPGVQIIWHNALYDAFVLAWTYGIVPAITDDTMVKYWELYCELPKSLASAASVLLRRPYWKEQRTSENDQIAWRYNGLDATATWELDAVISSRLKADSLRHYQVYMRLLWPLLYMQLRGIPFNPEKARELQAHYLEVVEEQQRIIDQCCIVSDKFPDLVRLYTEIDTFNTVAKYACRKGAIEKVETQVTTFKLYRLNKKKWVGVTKKFRESGEMPGLTQASPEPPIDPSLALWNKPITKTKLVSRPVVYDSVAKVEAFLNASLRAEWPLLKAYLEGDLTLATRVARLLGISLNMRASNQGGDAQRYLYDILKLPRQVVKGDEEDESDDDFPRLSTDDQAALMAIQADMKARGSTTPSAGALAYLRLKSALTASGQVLPTIDEDGRIRCSYILPGTETARLKCHKSITGSGMNLQTVAKKHRRYMEADPGYEMGQQDLSGADSWTVAAWAAHYGDRTYLEDLLARLKPAKVMCLMMEGVDLSALDRSQIKALCDRIDTDGWLYFANKRVGHASDYGMGLDTMIEQLLGDSWKLNGEPVFITRADAKRIQEVRYQRYPGIIKWKDAVKNDIMTGPGNLPHSSGFNRIFFGRRIRRTNHGYEVDHSTWNKRLAHEPQCSTTWATMMALGRLWEDPSNWRVDATPRVEPLHTVHDSLVTQWRVEERAYARVALPEWFNNEVEVAGVRIKIPADGTYGPDWEMKGAEKL